MNKKTILSILIFILCSVAVIAATNQTTYMIVRITNTAPTVNEVTVAPDPADPSTTMNITANVTDPNGVPADISSVVATYSGPGGETATVNLVFNGGTGLFENTTYTLPWNATPGTWNVSFNATDTAGTWNVNSTSFTVNPVVSITLHNTPVDFGNASVGVSDRRADNGTAGSGYIGGTIKGFPLKVNNTGNVDANYTIKGKDLMGQVDPNFNISVTDVKYDTDSNVAGATQLALADQSISNTNIPGSLDDVYFWITTPPSIPEQDYKGNLTISAVQS